MKELRETKHASTLSNLDDELIGRLVRCTIAARMDGKPAYLMLAGTDYDHQRWYRNSYVNDIANMLSDVDSTISYADGPIHTIGIGVIDNGN